MSLPLAALLFSSGTAEVLLDSGGILRAEIRWYEATGIGKREFKIKHLL